MTAAGLGATLKSIWPLTVSASSDEAFVKLPQGTVETLVKPESKAQFTKLLVLPGKVMATEIACLNGIIHVIDRVMVPEG